MLRMPTALWLLRAACVACMSNPPCTHCSLLSRHVGAKTNLSKTDIPCFLQIAAALIIIAGTVLGIVAWQQSQPASDLLLAHIVIGSLIFAFAMLQAGSALIARPRKDTRYR